VRHGRNLEEDVNIDQHEKHKKRQCLDHQGRVRHALAKLDVVVGQHMGQNIHGGCGDDLIKAESEIRLEPTPEQPIELVEDKEWDKDRPEQSNDCCRNRTVGQDGRDYRGQHG